MWHSRPPRGPPPFMAKTILNFHFDYLNPSLGKGWEDLLEHSRNRPSTILNFLEHLQLSRLCYLGINWAKSWQLFVFPTSLTSTSSNKHTSTHVSNSRHSKVLSIPFARVCGNNFINFPACPRILLTSSEKTSSALMISLGFKFQWFYDVSKDLQ